MRLSHFICCIHIYFQKSKLIDKCIFSCVIHKQTNAHTHTDSFSIILNDEIWLQYNNRTAGKVYTTTQTQKKKNAMSTQRTHIQTSISYHRAAPHIHPLNYLFLFFHAIRMIKKNGLISRKYLIKRIYIKIIICFIHFESGSMFLAFLDRFTRRIIIYC